MKFTPTKAPRVAAAAVLIAGLGATGCSAINYQATTHEYSASDGVIVEAEGVKLRHIMFVASEQDGPARLIGAISNTSQGEAEVEITVEGDSIAIPLEPGESYNLENDGEHVVESVSVPPGAMQEVTSSVTVTYEDGTTETVEDTFNATVLDGALEEYRDLLPDGFDASMVEHLEHGPDTWGSGAAHHDPDDAGH